MTEDQRRNAVELFETLREAGPNSGVIPQQGVAVVRSAGSPFHDVPTRFDENDLQAAVELGLLKKTRVTGSFEWEWYTDAGPGTGSAMTEDQEKQLEALEALMNLAQVEADDRPLMRTGARRFFAAGWPSNYFDLGMSRAAGSGL